MSLLEIENLSVQFGKKERPFRAVNDVSFTVDEGEVLGVVGESGCGKSVGMMALMGLLGNQGRVTADKMIFDDKDMLNISPRARRKIIGKDISMVFQDPMTALNPSFTVGYQIEEVLKVHLGLSGKELKERAVHLMEQVEIPEPQKRLSSYPHQMSGGMSQRVAIAMAIACEPKLLIADEPTTALDVTIQAQILDLLQALQQEKHMAMIMITHDLAVITEVAHKVNVMYAGECIETGKVPETFLTPSHPYTEALLSSLPESSQGERRLKTLPGIVPGPYDRPQGCLLSPRCPYADEACRKGAIPMRYYEGRAVRCLKPLQAFKEIVPVAKNEEVNHG